MERLVIVDGPERGRSVALSQDGSLSIGRGRDCELRFRDDPSVSKLHCEVRRAGNGCELRDLGSTSGTFLNGRRLGAEWVPLRAGDEVRLSPSTALRFEASPEATDATTDVPARAPAAAPASPPPRGPWPELAGYEIQGELGRGGMAVVYLATRPPSRDKVAVKVIKEGIVADPIAAEMFQREIATETQVDHPHVVRVLAQGAQGPRPWFAMAFIAGPNLERYVSDHLRRRLELREAVALLDPILDALEHVHARGIVHRDVKPSNILVQRPLPEPFALLGDFGLAKSFARVGQSFISRPGEGKGTPGYVAPEQISDSKHVGPPADVYSAAATFFWLVTGELPVDVNVPQWVRAVVKNPPRPLRSFLPEAPLEVDDIIRRALAKSPGDRPTLAELRAVLRLAPMPGG